MKNLLILLTLVTIFSCSQRDHIDVSDLHWLEGSWKDLEGGSGFYEVWEVEGDVIVGSGFVSGTAEPQQIESLQILSHEGDLFYEADVSANESKVYFKLVSNDLDRLVFENLEHDNPQRITYHHTDLNTLKVFAEVVTYEGDKLQLTLTREE